MNSNYQTTIAAPSTIPGTGAISIIRVSGPEALSIADKVISFRNGTALDTPGYRIKYGEVLLKDGSVIDQVLVSVFHSPSSYTGEDMVEISCHASKFIVSQIILRLVDEGATPAEPGEFTKRAFINGKMDLAQAEAVADVISSSSAASLRVAMNQLKGGFSNELKTMREKLLNVTSLMELELDFSEEDVEFADRSKLSSLVGEVLVHVSNLADSFRTGNAIKSGVPVAIAGPTNAGKSTLLNCLLGEERAIVSDIAGTTRDTIEETMTIDGVLFRFIDTAGIRESEDTIEKIGIERTYKKIEEADIVLGVVDGTESEQVIDLAIKDILDHIDLASQKAFILINKVDKEGYSTFPIDNTDIPTIEISAKTNRGIDALKELLSESQKERLSSNDETLVTNIRHYTALRNAAESLERVNQGISLNIPTDLVAQDLREALYHLGTIVGEISTDEVLGNIFSHFCIGK